ncbi:unnamed protein product [Durusdinium trenchii]|uniref:Cyclic nucleotide-binding domain-containing protein n=1 Tax=Durusdinium trenchii TaxID=1381693 RepID=A0ABP0NQG3_9DINO
MSQVKNTEERFWEGVCQLGSLILFNLLGRYVALDPFKGHLGCQMQHRPASTFEAAPRLYNEKTKKAEYAFFEGTSLKFLQTTAKMLEKERFEKQDYVFKEGEMGFSMYFICSGSIVISKGSDISDVEILSRGNHCGDSAVFGFSRRSTSAIAREHTECLVLKNRVFQAILERFPEEKEYFAKRADHKKKELRSVGRMQQRRTGRNFRPKRAWGGSHESSSDSDRDAADDPAPVLPSEDAAPLPDTEIPGAYPELKKMNILDLQKPPRHGPEQLVPPAPAKLPEDRHFQARMGKELATVGRTAFLRKMAVAEALKEEMAPFGSNSLRPQGAGAWKVDKKTIEEEKGERNASKERASSKSPRPPAVKKALEEDDFDLNFDLNNIDLNAIDPWRRAVSA